MITYRAKKMWAGRVSVRSCVVKFANKTKQSILIVYKGNKMVVNGKTPYVVTAPPQTAQRTDEYMRKGDRYELYDYDWNPIVENAEWSDEGRENIFKVYREALGKKDVQGKLF